MRDRGGSAGGQAVNVSFSAQQGLTGYTAQLNVVNDSAGPLASLTLSLPVRGQVLGVTGAGWTQDGDQLIIDMSRSLARGGSAKLTITAMGTASQPKNCGLVGGDCAIG
jgi:cellulase/cellobiase CelA1